MRYSIVLTPPIDTMNKYVDESQRIFAGKDPSYILTSDGKSIPHITVVQFDCENEETVKGIWGDFSMKMGKDFNHWEFKKFEPFSPPFRGVEFIEGKGIYEGKTWVELSVARGNEDSPTMSLHRAALKALKFTHKVEIKPLNPSCNNYRPHLTLGLRKFEEGEQIPMWSKDLLKDPGKFELKLGRSDENWQLVEIIDSF